MIAVTATIDREQLAEASRLLAGIKNGAPRAATRAINKVARSTRGQVVKQISAQTGLKQKEVRERITKLTLASFKKLVARLRLAGRPLPLIRYGATQTAAGVKHKAKGIENPLPEAFIATMPTGHQGVFRRRLATAGTSFRTQARTRRRLEAARAAGRRRVGRLPIDQQYGPSPLDGVDVTALQVRIDRGVTEEMHRQVRVLLEQEAAKAAARVVP